jgi:hypothetical protein
MHSIKTFTALAAGAVALSTAPLAQAQTPYQSGSTYNQPQQQQPSGQEVFGQILQSLFGGQSTGSLDSEWSRGRRALNTQQSAFNTRLDAQVRSGALSSWSADRIRTDYDALVQLETRYAQDGRFTTQERQDLTTRYDALTRALEDGGYGDVGGYQSAADGRADFDARVDAAVRARSLTRTEATRLRSDYAAIVSTEAGYLRQGNLTSRQRQDIEARLDAIDARLPGGSNSGGGWQQSPRDRLTAIERAVTSLSRTEQDRLRPQVEDLARLEAAYSRTRPAADDAAYLERRLGELETQARVRR